MKAFFKQVLAVVVGLLIVGLFFFIVSLMLLGSLMALGSTTPTVKDGTVLHLQLSGTIEERSEDSPFGNLLGSSAVSTQGLDDILTAIKVAKTDERVRGIYVEGGMLSADFASLEEIRQALVDFKKTGKFVLAYGESYTQGAYYVASAADSLFIHPGGMLDWHGIASEPIFYKELLDKIGVKMQVFRVGTYKSFVEPYTRTDMSEANRSQVRSFIADIWAGVCKDVSATRRISVDTLNALADRYVVLADASDYVKSRLADRAAYVDQVRETLRRMADTDEVHLITAADLAKTYEPTGGGDGEVVVYYAYGSIVGSEGGGLTSGGSQIVGTKVVEDLDRLAADENVKAVVLRVNSGGGSAFASEQMWRAVRLLREKKPVVVSMGGMAASGGYYMSCGADYIVAEPTTLTGSIGIFGMIPDATGLLTDKLGLHFDVVKTNAASDFGSMGRGFNAAESQAMQAYVDRGYALFLRRVATGRKMTTARVDSIAQGRVWTGAQALRLGLVDKLGSLDVAVAEAARRAKVKDYVVSTEPQQEDWFSQLLDGYKSDYMERRVSEVLGEYYEPLRFVGTLRGVDCLQARLPFTPNLR